ncbi:hypothetical protein FF011L_26840 [Roseimaritima multifibrata]|uniref:Uncharacterized protein n=1 Tax=Roseimaritima multifibrata TaxID=1930274 RepID=A0A517MGL8_9BACT|nr:hypothetical protein FF011L_26840 [Roseimaritima multifibrata]
MKQFLIQRYGWRSVGVACLVVFAGGLGVRSLLSNQEPTVMTKPVSTDADVDQIYTNHEPVGWVFGRVVGFQGADKPMLPHRSRPSMNRTSFARPAKP